MNHEKSYFTFDRGASRPDNAENCSPFPPTRRTQESSLPLCAPRSIVIHPRPSITGDFPMRKPHFLLACMMSIALAGAQAQSATDPDINKKIRAEETDHSQIMHTMHFLADVYGPRLTGSPNHKA